MVTSSTNLETPSTRVPGDRSSSAPAPSLDAPLALEGLHKHWKGNASPVLDGVDLEATAGTLTWIGGRNGTGKTTLLRIAAGLIRADSGSVRSFGLDPLGDRRDFQSRVGFLTAGSSGLYPRLTVRHQLEFQARICLLEAGERKAAVQRAIARFALTGLADRRVERMSMGQRQRLRLALTVLNRPGMLLLDEPRTSLDEEGEALLDAAVAEVTGGGGAVIWCSAPHEGAGVRADRHLILDAGRLSPA